MSTTRSLGAVAAEVSGMEIELTPAQADRLVRAVAVFEYKCHLLDQGLSVDEIDAKTLSVDVQPL
jgi:hypothetical protein